MDLRCFYGGVLKIQVSCGASIFGDNATETQVESRPSGCVYAHMAHCSADNQVVGFFVLQDFRAPAADVDEMVDDSWPSARQPKGLQRRAGEICRRSPPCLWHQRNSPRRRSRRRMIDPMSVTGCCPTLQNRQAAGTR